MPIHQEVKSSPVSANEFPSCTECVLRAAADRFNRARIDLGLIAVGCRRLACRYVPIRRNCADCQTAPGWCIWKEGRGPCHVCGSYATGQESSLFALIGYLNVSQSCVGVEPDHRSSKRR